MIRSLALLLFIPLTACSLGRPAADDLYVLKTETQASHARIVPLNLRIAEPEVAPGLNTERIAVMDTPNHLNYYTGAAWAQPLPVMVQKFLEDSFQQSHAFKSISNDEDGIAADAVLMTNIQEYEVDHNAAGETIVTIRLVAKLVDEKKHKDIATFTIEKTQTAKRNHMPDIVAAFNAAMDDAAADMIQRIEKTYGTKR